MTPAENDRLLHNGKLMLRWAGVSPRERQILIGIRARHKKNPAYQLSATEAPWLERLVERFQRETLADAAGDKTDEAR